jgi:hypothetical protein
MFHYRVLNNDTEVKFKTKLNELFDDWLEYLQDDDKYLCTCVACVAQRNDIAISSDAIENIIKALHKELREDDDDNDDDDREDA